MNTYCKLSSGDWGVKCDNPQVKIGDTVSVTKKDGTVNSEKVDKILSVGPQYAICTIVRKTSVGYANPRNTKTCWECGRLFTYAECKAAGGDWSDSYCGC